MALVSDLHIGTQLSGSVLGFIVIRIWNQDLTFFTKNNQENLPFFKSSMENVARKANVEKWKNDKKIFIKKSFCFLAFYPLGSGSRRHNANPDPKYRYCICITLYCTFYTVYLCNNYTKRENIWNISLFCKEIGTTNLHPHSIRNFLKWTDINTTVIVWVFSTVASEKCTNWDFVLLNVSFIDG